MFYCDFVSIWNVCSVMNGQIRCTRVSFIANYLLTFTSLCMYVTCVPFIGLETIPVMNHLYSFTIEFYASVDNTENFVVRSIIIYVIWLIYSYILISFKTYASPRNKRSHSNIVAVCVYKLLWEYMPPLEHILLLILFLYTCIMNAVFPSKPMVYS